MTYLRYAPQELCLLHQYEFDYADVVPEVCFRCVTLCHQFGPKIQIKYIDTKNQLADILTEGIRHFSSTARIAAMEKRAQQESGEGRVAAKSRPMMNLTTRMPSVVSSSASANPGMTSYGYQGPGKSVASDDRTEKPVQPSRPD